jgi:hypothetical protein
MCNELIPQVKQGKIVSLPGVERIIGPSSVKMTDGRVIEDIDPPSPAYKDDLKYRPMSLLLLMDRRGKRLCRTST